MRAKPSGEHAFGRSKHSQRECGGGQVITDLGLQVPIRHAWQRHVPTTTSCAQFAWSQDSTQVVVHARMRLRALQLVVHTRMRLRALPSTVTLTLNPVDQRLSRVYGLDNRSDLALACAR